VGKGEGVRRCVILSMFVSGSGRQVAVSGDWDSEEGERMGDHSYRSC